MEDFEYDLYRTDVRIAITLIGTCAQVVLLYLGIIWGSVLALIFTIALFYYRYRIVVQPSKRRLLIGLGFVGNRLSAISFDSLTKVVLDVRTVSYSRYSAPLIRFPAILHLQGDFDFVRLVLDDLDQVSRFLNIFTTYGISIQETTTFAEYRDQAMAKAELLRTLPKA